MTATTDRRAAQIFATAVELDADAARRWVAEQCAGDKDLRREVESLLEVAAHSEEYFGGLADRLGVGELLHSTATDGKPGRSAGGEIGEPGQVVGPYTLATPIGEGGMGTVWLADRSDGRFDGQVAIKLLNVAGGAIAARSFELEGTYLARLTHPNIARLLDAGIGPHGAPYLVLEYVEGTAIDAYCDAHRLTIADRLRLFRDVVTAVAHAHTHLIVHRDIKPSNILVTADGSVKLLDFGIAKLLNRKAEVGPEQTHTVALAMTPGYASPEQVRGEPVTTATDVYALGLLLYELLCGRRAQQPEDASFAALERTVAEDEPAPPSVAVGAGADDEVAARAAARRETRLPRLRQQIRGDLDTLVTVALRKDPTRRYSSAEQLREDLDRHLAGHPLLAQPDTFGYRTGKFLRRHRLGVAASAAIALSLVVGLALALVGMVRARSAEIEARTEAVTSEQISEFLVSIFDAADPEFRHADAPPMTARELLDAGLARVDRVRVDDPDVGARLELTLGRMARKVGEYERAKELLARVAERAPDSVVQRQALFELGAAQGRSGDAEAALTTLDAALERCRAAADELCIVEALTVRGDVEHERRDFDAARRSLNEAITRAQALPVSRKSRYLIARTTYGLAATEHRTGNLEAANELFARAAELFRRLEGEPTIEAGESYLALGATLVARGEHERAEQLLTQARRILVELYGEGHLRVAYLDFIATACYTGLGQTDRAQRAAENALALRREVLGDRHADTGIAWGRLAEVLAARGDMPAAIEAAERARAITASTHQLSYANVGTLLAEYYAEAAEAETALAVARESLAIYEAIFGAESAMALRAHAAVATALAAGGDLGAAVRSQRHAVALGDAQLRAAHPRRVALRLRLGELERQAGRIDEARRSLTSAIELADSAEPPQPEQVATARALLAELD